MQIECATTSAAAQVMVALMEQKLRSGKDFYLDGPNLPDPPTSFTIHVNLSYSVMSQLQAIADTISTGGRGTETTHNNAPGAFQERC
jgi:hypothetical protein